MTSTLYNVYNKFGTVAEIWNGLIKKYMVKNVGIEKYTVWWFMDFKMVARNQICDL